MRDAIGSPELMPEGVGQTSGAMLRRPVSGIRSLDVAAGDHLYRSNFVGQRLIQDATWSF